MIASIFNTIVDSDNGEKLIYNSLRNSLARLDSKSYEVYRRIMSKDSERWGDMSDQAVYTITASLERGGFIVEDGMDEISYVRVVDIQSRFSWKNRLRLTIAVTADCNFDCVYCYENIKQPVYMNRKTEEKIIDYVDKRLEPNGELSITWYGGEPLLALDMICSLSESFIEIASKKKARYSAYIITNGYLLNVNVVNILKKCCVTGAQVTVDGPPAYHDSVRRLKNGAGTFDRILGNIRDIALKESGNVEDNGFRVSIRMNVGKGNSALFPAFVDKLEEYGVKDKIALAVTQLEPHEFLPERINNAALTPEEFSRAYAEIVRIAVERRVPVQVIPDRSMQHCSSTSKDGFLVGPDGSLYKCWDVLGNPSESVGEIGSEVKIAGRSLKWLAWDVAENAMCRSCSVLPLCMGGCPRKVLVKDRFANSMDRCSFLKYNLPELMRIMDRQSMIMRKKA